MASHTEELSQKQKDVAAEILNCLFKIQYIALLYQVYVQKDFEINYPLKEDVGNLYSLYRYCL